MSRATAAPAIWPYPHRTLAEVYGGTRAERRERRIRAYMLLDKVTPADVAIEAGAVARSTLPATPCVRCGSRGLCGHAGRVPA